MIELIPLITFPLLRMLDGADKIPRWAMCAGMAGIYSFPQAVAIIESHQYEFWESFARIGIILYSMWLALLWAFSYGWSLSAVNGQFSVEDWLKKFNPSGDLLVTIHKQFHKLPYDYEGCTYNRHIYGALGWTPRIAMTFWLPCAIAGNVWGVIPLALLWGWCYYLGGMVQRRVNRDIGTRIAEGLTGIMLAVALTY